jgi:uncharacterized protein (TIGR03067 family)
MTARTPLALAAALVLCAGAARSADDKDLEGTWEVVKVVKDGKEMKPEGKGLLILKGGSFVVKVDDKAVAGGTYKVDTSKTPHALDATYTEGPNKGKTALVIYEIKGDELHSSMAAPGKERPTEMSAKEGSGNVYRVYKRVKP